jgi:hypothetical protein
MGPAKALTRRHEASSARTSRDELARSERTALRSTRTLDTHLSNADQTTTTVLVPSRKELEGVGTDPEPIEAGAASGPANGADRLAGTDLNQVRRPTLSSAISATRIWTGPGTWLMRRHAEPRTCRARKPIDLQVVGR